MSVNVPRRLWFWILAAAFAWAMFFWVTHVPYRPDRLFRAIPANSAWISVHDGLAARWAGLSGNPLIMTVLNACGIDLETQAMLAADKDFQYWFRHLAPDRAVTAFVPSFFRQGQQAWVVASWLGGDSQRLRWLLTWTGQHPCRREGRHQGRILWALDTGDGRTPFRFALVEGGVIGVLCDDPAALRALLDMYDGRLPSAASVIEAFMGNSMSLSPSARDFGLFNAGALPMSFALDNVTPDGLTLSMAAPLPLQVPADWLEEGQYDELVRVIGDVPLAALLVSRQALLSALEHPLAALPASAARYWISRMDGESLMLSVLGGEYSGRIRGIKWPALLAGVPIGEAAEAREVMQPLLDDLNRTYQWGLILHEIPQGDQPAIYIIESTAGNAYGKLNLQEQMACTVRGGWLLLASNSGTLMKICGRYSRGEQGASAGWIRPVPGDAALCRLDLAGGGKIVKLALGAYSLKLLFSDPDGTQEERQRINEYKAWIDMLAPFGQLRARVYSDNEQAILKLHMGTGSGISDN